MIKVVSRKKCLLLIAIALALGAGTRPTADYFAAKTMDPMLSVSDAVQRHVAIHEAGHSLVARNVVQTIMACLVAYALNPKRLIGLHVITEHRQSSAGLGLTNFTWTEGLATSTEVFDLVAVLMGGMASEAVVAGDITIGNGDDLARANAILAQACGLKAMCGSLLVVNGGPALEAMVQSHLLTAHFRARTILKAHIDVVKALADEVMAQPAVNGQRSLNAEALAKFFAAHPVPMVPPESRQIAPIVNEVSE